MIHYLVGNALKPCVEEGIRIIPHVCNDIGKWGRGFVLSLSKEWPQPEAAYHKAYSKGVAKLGYADLVTITKDLYVLNMVAQHGIYPQNGTPPIRYDALRECMEKLANLIHYAHGFSDMGKITIHAPRFGSKLAGGEWSRIEAMINEIWHDIDVYVYDLPRGK